MRTTHPRKRDVIIWNTLAIVGGLIGGDLGYVYTTMALFIGYVIWSLIYDFNNEKASRANFFIIGAFALFNLQFFGPVGLGLTVQSAVNMYIMFLLVIPMANMAKEKYKARKLEATIASGKDIE